MSFFIFTGVLISGAIFIVHFAANRCGLRLFFPPLILSALLAVLINLLIISLKEVSSPQSIGKIIVAVLLASAAVTVFNDFLMRREKKKLLGRKSAKNKGKDTEAAIAAPIEETNEVVEESVEPENVNNIPEKEGFIKRMLSGIFRRNSEEKPKLPEFDNLDAMLDFAYESRRSGHYKEAVAAYEAAVEKYKDDPYIPFIFIDMGNAHKEAGKYDAAIEVYERAADISGIKQDTATLRSFEENAEYLKELKAALKKHKMEHTPFSKISKEILNEVDEGLKHKEADHEKKQ